MFEVFQHIQVDLLAVETNWQLRNEHRHISYRTNRPNYVIDYKGVTCAGVQDVPRYQGAAGAVMRRNWDLHTIGDGRLQDGHASGRLATCVDKEIGDIVSHACYGFRPQGGYDRTYGYDPAPPKMVHRMHLVCRLQYPNDQELDQLNLDTQLDQLNLPRHELQAPVDPDRLAVTRAWVRHTFAQVHHRNAYDTHICAVVAYQRDLAHRQLGISQHPQWDPEKANANWGEYLFIDNLDYEDEDSD
jgi:hypothetical protein